MDKSLLLVEINKNLEERKFLFQNYNIDSIKENAFYLHGDIYNIKNDEKISRYFLFSLDKKVNIDSLTELNEDLLIVGFEKKNIPIIHETWYKVHFDTFNSLEEAIKYSKTLENSNVLEVCAFYIKDNIADREVDKIHKKLNERKDYSLRVVHYEGDIIITDPCYIEKEIDETKKPKWSDFFDYKSMKEYPDYDGKTSKLFSKHSKEYDDAYKIWKKEHPSLCDLTYDYEDFRPLGFLNTISHSTLYGDWDCITFNSDTKEPIGEFCADSGMVAVFSLDEVLKYNPDFDYHINKPWTTTWIKNFKGDVCFKILDEETIIVKGIGNINFETKQTGL